MHPLERLAVTGQLEREAVGGALPAAREPGLEGQRGDLEQPEDEQDERHDTRIARPRGPARREEPRPGEQAPDDQHRRSRAGHPKQRPSRDVPEAPVPELVRDHATQLVGRCVLQKRVVEDEPPRRAEARDVGVVLTRSPARVGNEHRAHRHPRPLRQTAQVARQLLVRQRPEAVEEPLEEQRREQAQARAQERRPGRDDERPPAGPGARGTDERHEPKPGQRRHPSTSPFTTSTSQARRRLCREAPAPLVGPAAPGRERQPHERPHPEHERRQLQRASPPRPRRQRSRANLPAARTQSPASTASWSARSAPSARYSGRW